MAKIYGYKLNKTTAKKLVASMLECHLGVKAKWDIRLMEMGKVGQSIRVEAVIGDITYEITGKTFYSTFSIHDGYEQDELFMLNDARLEIRLPKDRTTNVTIA